MDSGASPKERLEVLGALILPVVIGAVIYLAGAFGSVEVESLSLRFDVRGERNAGNSVVLVALDQPAMLELKDRWGERPYSRLLWAKLLKRLRQSGAGPVAIDVAFDLPRSRGEDRPFEQELQRYRRAAVAFNSFADGGRDPIVLSWYPGGLDRFSALSVKPGLTSYGGDGSKAGLVPGMLAGAGGYETLGVTAARLARPIKAPSADKNGELLLNFYGPPGTIRRVDAASLLDRGTSSAVLRKELAGKLVVVGFDDPLDPNDRPRPTTAPGDGTMSGAEIHATTAANALDGSFLRKLPAPLSLLVIAVMGLALPASALSGRSRLLSLGIGIALAALFVALAFVAFEGNIVVPVVGPAAAFLASIGSWIYLRNSRTERDLSELRRRFADFEPDLVGGVLAGTLDDGGLDAEMIVPGYRLEAVLGRGAMGVVYRAEAAGDGRAVAIKIIRPDLSDNPNFRDRFEREARLAAALEHPNVLPVYEAGDEDGMLFLATRLVEGPDLAKRLRSQGAMGDDDVIRVVDGLASALDRAHEIGLVHRDVKPANVLLDEADNNHPYLTDFGIATMVGERTITQAGGVIGTFGFSAPEQLAGSETGPAADIYGLGAVTFAALSGGAPPPSPFGDAVESEWPEEITSRPAVRDTLAKALANDPTERYASAMAFFEALRTAIGKG